MQSSKRESVPATKPDPKASRKTYENPKLAEHGDVRSLTKHEGKGGSCLYTSNKPA